MKRIEYRVNECYGETDKIDAVGQAHYTINHQLSILREVADDDIDD